MLGCDESALTKQMVFSTLHTLGRVGMCWRADVARCASFQLKSEGSSLAMDRDTPGFEASAQLVGLGIAHLVLGGARKAGSKRDLESCSQYQSNFPPP